MHARVRGTPFASNGMSRGSLAQRRDGQRHSVQAKIKVARKLPRDTSASRSRLVARDEPHVDLARADAADAQHLARLEHAQQLALQDGGNSPISSRKDRAAGRFRAGPAWLARAGERAAFVPEQLALRQRRRPAPRS
jgi:hypothetical protein